MEPFKDNADPKEVMDDYSMDCIGVQVVVDYEITIEDS